jgi:protein-tyrosine phosphatase
MMIDIHIHILQGLDDGAMDMPEALMMLSRAQTAGITDVIATPHSWAVDDSTIISKAASALNAEALSAGLSVRVHTGCEFNVMRGEAIRRQGNRLSELTLAGSRYLLTEFSSTVPERTFLTSIEEISALGLIPIVAHPERYALMWRELTAMKAAKELGALGQISMGDLLGRNGNQSMDAAFAMIRDGLCQFCATDAHTPDKLELYIQACSVVKNRFGKEAAHRLFRGNPEAVLADLSPENIRAAN